MKVVWVRLNDTISFNKPSTWFVLGLRGSGKSSLLEHVACNYLEEGHVVLDLFGSRDGEGLAWLRSPYAKDKKILLLRGENVDVEASFPVKQADQLSLKDLKTSTLSFQPARYTLTWIKSFTMQPESQTCFIRG
jgi:energy-coupling factor transporter ATP-binding protein EcfA2